MEFLLERLMCSIFSNDCRYAEIFIEEIGSSEEENFSIFKVLVKSFDAGFNTNSSEEIIMELINTGSQNINFISLYAETNELTVFNEVEISRSTVKRPNQYGTSFSLVFKAGKQIPEALFSILSNPEYMCRLKFEYTPKSFFRDLSGLGFRTSLCHFFDYEESIISSIQAIVSMSPALQQSISQL